MSNLKQPLLEQKYEFLFRTKFSMPTTEACARSTSDFPRVLGSKHRDLVILVEDSLAGFFVSREETEENKDLAFNLLDEKTFDEHFSGAENAKNSFRLFAEKAKAVQDYSRLSNEELNDLHQEFSLVFKTLLAYFWVSRPEFSDSMSAKLVALVRQKVGDEGKANECLEVLGTPCWLDPIKREEIAWASLMQKASEMTEEALMKACIAHAHSFPWLLYKTYRDEDIINFFKKKISSTKKEDPRKFEELRNKEVTAWEEKRSKILEELNDDEIASLSKVIRKNAAERLEIKSCWGGIEFVALPLLKEIAKRVSLPTEEFVFAYDGEAVQDFLKTGKKLSDSELKERKKAYLFRNQAGEVRLHFGEEALQLKKDLLSGSLPQTDANVIKGVTASKGKVKGPARIVLTTDVAVLTKKMEEFKEGEVLVTIMTQPNMVPVMKKASAFVTDEGGILSHAAIIAREFGKPCVVGTKIATQVLRDGMLVEVDADNGVVKILSERE